MRKLIVALIALGIMGLVAPALAHTPGNACNTPAAEHNPHCQPGHEEEPSPTPSPSSTPSPSPEPSESPSPSPSTSPTPSDSPSPTPSETSSPEPSPTTSPRPERDDGDCMGSGWQGYVRYRRVSYLVRVHTDLCGQDFTAPWRRIARHFVRFGDISRVANPDAFDVAILRSSPRPGRPLPYPYPFPGK